MRKLLAAIAALFIAAGVHADTFTPSLQGIPATTSPSWVPTEASGGVGVTLTVTNARYAAGAGFCILQFDIAWSTNGDTNAAAVGGLPTACANGASSIALPGGAPAFTNQGSPLSILVTTGNQLQFYNASGTALLNSNLSGKNARGTLVLLTK
jgi:hypothetical protein